MVRVLHDILFSTANKKPDKEALFFKDDTMRYKDVAAQSRNLASLLMTIGVAKGERVAFLLEKRFEKVISIFGISATGGVNVPIKRLSQPHQVAYILKNCGAKVFITTSSRFENMKKELVELETLEAIILLDGESQFENPQVRLIDWAEVEDRKVSSDFLWPKIIESDLAAILYTSGSTGQPKGVILNHLNIVSGAKSVSEYLENTENDRLLSILSFGFDYGLSQLTTSFLCGAQLVLLDHLFNKDIITAVEKYNVTGLAAVATTWNQLVQSEWDYPTMSSLRYITNSGGVIPKNNVLELHRRLKNTSIYLMYGLTEAFRSTFLHPSLVEKKPTSMGQAIPGNEVLVIDENNQIAQVGQVGELVHRGPLVAQGYWGDPDLTAVRYRQNPLQNPNVPIPEIVVFSGDYVKRDEDGDLYFLGRKDEMIKCSGHRISPTEVEEIIYRSELVQDAVVLGIPDDIYGQAIMAVVVPRPQIDFHEQDLLKYCKKFLPPYMMPKAIRVHGELPKNASGKLDRSSIKSQVLESLQKEVQA